jgi:hypothetical protein
VETEPQSDAVPLPLLSVLMLSFNIKNMTTNLGGFSSSAVMGTNSFNHYIVTSIITSLVTIVTIEDLQ